MSRTLAQEVKHRLAIIERVHCKAIADADREIFNRGGPIPHCDCSRCMMVKRFRDQFKPDGSPKYP